MKTLFESLLDDEDILISNDNAIIEEFLNKNYQIEGTYNIHDEIVDINGDIRLVNYATENLTNDLFKFGKISGTFNCSGTCITNLNGAPRETGKNFNCSDCNYLISLKGCPEIVGRNFNCGNCQKLIDLEGSPKKLLWQYSSFTCRLCKGLKTLKGCPQVVNGGFDCEGCTNLTNLKYGPKKAGSMNCDGCKKLKDVSDRPKITSGSFSFLYTPAYNEYEQNGRQFK